MTKTLEVHNPTSGDVAYLSRGFRITLPVGSSTHTLSDEQTNMVLAFLKKHHPVIKAHDAAGETREPEPAQAPEGEPNEEAEPDAGEEPEQAPESESAEEPDPAQGTEPETKDEPEPAKNKGGKGKGKGKGKADNSEASAE